MGAWSHGVRESQGHRFGGLGWGHLWRTRVWPHTESRGIHNTFYKEVLGERYLEELLARQGLNFSYIVSSYTRLFSPETSDTES